MVKFNVHLYREMKLLFPGIEAETPEAAGAIAREKPTDDAEDIEDCNGEDLAALIDVAGDEDYSQSVTIEFETESQRRATPKLLAALDDILPYAVNESESLYECWKRDNEESAKQALDACEGAIEQARIAIAEANTAGITLSPAGSDAGNPAETRYVIGSAERAYWSNAGGWGDYGAADVFTAAERATLRLPLGGQWAALKPYSVLLLNPDYINDWGNETYYAFVEAPGPDAAVDAARRQAVAAQEVEIDDPDDFALLLVTEGHHPNEPIFNR